ncbi:hypothetical protein OG696_37580 [Streptomyces sp. NBC_00656]|uniref:hypothetical protein n=1 Tax=Streptomyces sp. NBC_00656 TaxID=2903668 RepID=UPI0032529EC7
MRRVGGKLGFGPPKGDKVRTTPFPEYLAARIREHRKAVPPQAVTLLWREPRTGTTKRETEERAPRTHKYAHFMPEADGRSRAAMDAWFGSAVSAAQTISPDSPQARDTSGEGTSPDRLSPAEDGVSSEPHADQLALARVG